MTLKLDGTSLSAIYSPARNPLAVLVLAHGAGAGHDHAHMTSIADALNKQGISTLRFNFPFTEEGRRRVDKPGICFETLQSALNTASRLAPDMTRLLGGHSFGGRMATHYAHEHPGAVKGLILFSFPLHASKKPDTKRAAHLASISEPMLFVSGDRDTLAERELLEQVLTPCSKATLHWLATADHSFKILKRTRVSEVDVYDEAAETASSWIRQSIKT